MQQGKIEREVPCFASPELVRRGSTGVKPNTGRSCPDQAGAYSGNSQTGHFWFFPNKRVDILTASDRTTDQSLATPKISAFLPSSSPMPVLPYVPGPAYLASPYTGRHEHPHVKIQFLGAAGTVTGSQYLLTTDRARILVDCGMFQGSPEEAARNRAGFAYDPATIDAVLLTHAHLDHCGMLPALVKGGYRGPIITTTGTRELAELVLLDSGKLQVQQAQAHNDRLEREARREARTPRLPARRHPAPRPARWSPPAPHRRRARAAPGVRPRALPARRRRPGAPGVRRTGRSSRCTTATTRRPRCCSSAASTTTRPSTSRRASRATFHDAGHILGSAIIVLEVAQAAGTPRRIVFSGDVGRPDTPILRDPTAIVDGADYVLMESTYGGREHEPEDEAIRLLAEAVHATADHSGVLLIPSFAIGRTQEIVWHLDRLLTAGAHPARAALPGLADGLQAPATSTATIPGYYDAETHRLLATGETPLEYPGEIDHQRPPSESQERSPRAPGR